MNAYDEVPYPGLAYTQTHPDRLATLATLFGMQPAPVEACRVLELGCADGANLIPMALGLPGSEFVGVDLSERQIARGRETVETLGLKNIVFHRADLSDIVADLGQFDYVVAYGVYSWVPPGVRDRLLALCRARLRPQGVAYVNYNAYPGCHMREMTWEMMQFHVRHLDDPETRIGQARALVRFLSESQPIPEEYRTFLKKEWDLLQKRRDGAVYHDDLGNVNFPVYFYQFVEHAARHGLQYLSEANLQEMQFQTFEPGVTEALRTLAGDPIAMEQYMDFLRCRRFRQTLLCHQEVPLNRNLSPDRAAALHVASSARPVSPRPDIASTSREEFVCANGTTFSAEQAFVKAALVILSEAWPRPIRFQELLDCARSRAELDAAGPDDSGQALQFGRFLLETFASGVVDLHIHAPRFVTEAGERPVASPLARLQALGQDTLTTLRHTSVRPEGPLERQTLILLDGTRDRKALYDDLAACLTRDGIPLRGQDGGQVSDPQEALRILGEKLDPMLVKLARFALLVA